MQVLHLRIILNLVQSTQSDVITGKDRCGVGKHFLTKCTDGNRVENIEVQLIEQMQERNYDLKGKLWCREKY